MANSMVQVGGWHGVKVGVAKRLRVVRWRSKNFDRVLRHQFGDRRDRGLQPMLDELRREGIITRPLSAVFSLKSQSVFADATILARQLWDQARAALERGELGDGSAYEGKEYKAQLLPRQLSAESPFLQLALDPNLLQLANRYLRMRACLREVNVWWDRPTSTPAKETQLWHRDGDDVMNVKVFVLFNDVDLAAGPFCFASQTHPLGRRRDLAPERDPTLRRTTDEQMARVLPPSAWTICTGLAGTVVVCDTCGFHKGQKPIRKDRLMMIMHYTSGTCRYPRMFELVGTPTHPWTGAQRDALRPYGRFES